MKYNVIVFGTRPELIKLIPVLLEIRKRNLGKRYKVVCTGQHKELIEGLPDLFQISPDVHLPVSNKNNSISETLSAILKELQLFIDEEKGNIEYIIGQGDTTSCLAAAMVAKLNEIPFAHIEAGLRTHDMNQPFPEEYFRRQISLAASVHFTPTDRATQNLLAEQVVPDTVLYTGNTVVDMIEILQQQFDVAPTEVIQPLLQEKNTVLVTCHRRENQNGNFDTLIRTVLDLAEEYPGLNFVWLSHPNPFVATKTKNQLGHKTDLISVFPPVTLFDMIGLYQSSKVIITDSGGIQEEAVSFNVPTIVVRKKTERPEAVEIGNSIVVGNSPEKLKSAFHKFIRKTPVHNINPFGDGKAAIRIIDFLENQKDKQILPE